MSGLLDESVPWGDLSQYMRRGQAIVRGRTPDVVNWGSAIVDWALNEVLPKLKANHPELFDPQHIETESPLTTLSRLRMHIAIDGMLTFPNATWAELFACYGITRIGQAHVSLQRKRDLNASENALSRELARDLDGYFLEHLLEAVAAIQLAERLAEVQIEAMAEAAQIVSAQQSEKAIKRHAETNRLQDRFEEFFFSRGGGNKTQAAKDFLNMLNPTDRKQLTIDDDNAIRTLTRGLLKRQTARSDNTSR